MFFNERYYIYCHNFDNPCSLLQALFARNLTKILLCQCWDGHV